MASYDPLELAAYLRRARHPEEGFTPSFTNVDGAGPYDFDVRSPEEMAGGMIDPLEDVVTDPIADSIAAFEDPDQFEDEATILAEIRKIEDEMDQLVTGKKKETEDKFGVTQAKEQFQLFSSAGISADNPVYQRAQEDLRQKQLAANLTFGVVNGDTLVGSETDQFRPYETQLKALDDRLSIVRKQQVKDDQIEGELRRVGLQDQANIKSQTRARDQRELDAKRDAYSAKGFNTKTIEYVERISEKEPTLEDIRAMSPTVATLYSRAAAGEELPDPVSQAAIDPSSLSVYEDLIKADAKKTEEEKTGILDMMDTYKRASEDARAIPDSKLFTETEWRSVLSEGKDKRNLMISEKRKEKIRNSIYAEADKAKKKMLTFSRMSLKGDTNFQPMEQVAGESIISLIKDEFGVDNLNTFVQEYGDSLTGSTGMLRVQALYNDTLPGKQGIPFTGIFDAMIFKLIEQTNEEGRPKGIIVSPKDDPTIAKLRMLSRSFGSFLLR